MTDLYKITENDVTGYYQEGFAENLDESQDRDWDALTSQVQDDLLDRVAHALNNSSLSEIAYDIIHSVLIEYAPEVES